MPITTISDFYKEVSTLFDVSANRSFSDGLPKEIGQFNIFDISDLAKRYKEKPATPYRRRAYYKISLISGRNIVEYADKEILIEKNALLFASPQLPYQWIPQDAEQAGYFCLFTHDFLLQTRTGFLLDEMPLFKPGGHPCFPISEDDAAEIAMIFKKMQRELSSSYVYKYDLIRNYIVELIHYGRKLQPATMLYATHNASTRIASLFVELLERQFPIESPLQTLTLRTAKDYAERLAIHVNYLNKLLKTQTGQTTKHLINNRIAQEAKILLKQTDWNVSEIAYSLGFEELAHFSNFFKKHSNYSPLAFRG